MYKALNQGSVTDKQGRTYRFGLDTEIDAPKGSLDHCKDLKWINPEKVKSGEKPGKEKK
ncbi:MAG: hypothetical protein JXL67_06150 [Calditrichaeota bacterium]|nr:hypothetical protein [Calditrichota bacterium]